MMTERPTKTPSAHIDAPNRHVACARTIAFAVAMLLLAWPASAQLRVVSYNTAQLQGDQAALEGVLAALMDDDKPGFAIAPAVIVFQEVKQDQLATLVQMARDASPPDVFYWEATYTNDNEDPYGGAQAMIYDFTRLTEVEAEHDDIYTQAGRRTDRWKLTLNGYDSPDASFYVYSSHLKAGDTSDDEAERLQGVQSIRDNADDLPADSHIVYCGDLNLYGNSEPAYQWYFTTGNGRAFDPLGSGSWAGEANAIKHSQSPRLYAGGGLVGGGLDDRFDFQLLSYAFDDEDGLAILNGTYRSLGNDASHYNDAINSGNNFYYPWDIPRSNALADDLHDASDHVPVVVDYQIPAVMIAGGLPGDFGRVIQSTAYEAPFVVMNAAEVTVPEGADVLDYRADGAGCLVGFTTGSAEALEGFVDDTIVVDTSQVGAVSGSLTITSDNEAAQNGLVVRSTQGTIVAPANASFESGADTDTLVVEKTYEADTGVQQIEVAVHNFGFNDLQALLDIDAVTPPEDPFAFEGGLTTGIGDTPATLTFSFDTTGATDGQYIADLDITASDEDIPGESASYLDLTLAVTIGGSDCPADVNFDGYVDIDDLFAVLGAWGACDDCPEDINDDSVVDIDDVFAVLADWGACP